MFRVPRRAHILVCSSEKCAVQFFLGFHETRTFPGGGLTGFLLLVIQ